MNTVKFLLITGFVFQLIIIVLKLLSITVVSWFIILMPTIILVIMTSMIMILLIAITKTNRENYDKIDDIL